MSSEYTEFTDVTGEDADRDPLVRGGLVAYYGTGSGGVPETAAQFAAAKAAGEGVVTIDQTPGLVLFRQGKADVGDIEYLAGTDLSAALAVKDRIVLGITEHTLYVSLSGLPALRQSVTGMPGVVYGVADYSWSVIEAESFLAATPDAVYAQFGDPASNPSTDVPGTSVTLTQAQADIDVAKSSWAAQFLPGASSPAPSVPWQEAAVQALPEISQGSTDATVVRTAQGLCVARGHAIAVDGDFGPQTLSAVKAVQLSAKIGADGIVGPQTWPALLGV